MQVHEIMTENPACCSPESSLQEAAELMVDCDCGEIPVLDEQKRPVGVITDRDICCRAVAQGLDPQSTPVSQIMSSPVQTIGPNASIDECCQLMDDHQIRRVPVVDDSGVCCGIVSQADIARAAGASDVGEMVRDISQPSASQMSH